MKKYYEAYEDRYKTAHEKGVSWSSSQCRRQGTVLCLLFGTASH